MQNRRLNQKGVTLVEVMISLVILLIVFMGLIQASLVSINTNMRNAVRDGATSIASEYMSRAKATPIANLMPGVTYCAVNTTNPFVASLNGTINRQVRNVIQQYTVATTGCITDSTLSSAQVTVTVSYTYQGEDPNNPQNAKTTKISSIVRSP